MKRRLAKRHVISKQFTSINNIRKHTEQYYETR